MQEPLQEEGELDWDEGLHPQEGNPVSSGTVLMLMVLRRFTSPLEESRFTVIVILPRRILRRILITTHTLMVLLMVPTLMVLTLIVLTLIAPTPSKIHWPVSLAPRSRHIAFGISLPDPLGYLIALCARHRRSLRTGEALLARLGPKWALKNFEKLKLSKEFHENFRRRGTPVA
jgi:hypothetical protein